MTQKKVLVGAIGKPYGIKGWVKINSYTEPVNNILAYQPWYVAAPGKTPSLSLIEIIDSRLHGQQILVLFSNSTTPESAGRYTNYKIYVERGNFFPLAEKEYYWTDLEGLKVYTCENAYLGIIQAVFATGANDVLVITDKKRHLIPFLLDQTIKSIDLENKTMIVDWDAEF
ncbi:MAG: ribosome maturation factor RimM [Gammaproteobacteria bacterium]|nr:MAG: ribosome maturation factor RimM [Gammaproteobacteria bacterium]